MSQADLERLMRQEAERHNLGATGKPPQEPLLPEDQGELRAALTAFMGRVVINFGKHISWVAIKPADARALAAALVEKAAEAEKDSATPPAHD